MEEAKHTKEEKLTQTTGKAAERSEPFPQQKKVIRNQGQGHLSSTKENTCWTEGSDEKAGSKQHVYKFQAARK